MQSPKPKGAPIDARRYRDWEEKFEGYRSTISQRRIERWLDQFEEDDRDSAARLLDSVEYFGLPDIAAAFRGLIDTLPGWHRDEDKREGKWRFVPFSGSPGESGDSMTHQFRIATGMSAHRYDQLFAYRSDLARAGLGPDDSVVLIDDFAGTGGQASTAWEKQFAELLFASPKVYLVLVAADYRGIEAIRSKTPIAPVPFRTLSENDNLQGTRFFDKDEKQTLTRYCEKASSSIPLGFGELGVVAVFPHRCPNNSLAALHARGSDWEPLFPRV